MAVVSTNGSGYWRGCVGDFEFARIGVNVEDAWFRIVNVGDSERGENKWRGKDVVLVGEAGDSGA